MKYKTLGQRLAGHFDSFAHGVIQDITIAVFPFWSRPFKTHLDFRVRRAERQMTERKAARSSQQ